MAQSINKKNLEQSDVINEHTGEQWLYSDTVKDHFFHPRNLLLTPPADNEFNARGTVGSPACLLPGTLVQTKIGFQPIENIKKNEQLLGSDGNFHTIEQIFRTKYNTELITIKTSVGELTATPEHLVYAMSIPRSIHYLFVRTRDKQRQPAAWFHAANLKAGDIVLYPVPREDVKFKFLSVPQFFKKPWDFRSKPLPKKIPLNRETLLLFGYFVAEGFTKKDYAAMGWTFSDREMSYAHTVVRLLKKYFAVGARIIENPAHHRIDVVVANVRLAHAFSLWFGEGAENKKIPAEFLLLPSKLQAAFLRGVWRGDGHFRQKYTCPRAGFATISKVLVEQIQTLLWRQKIIFSVYTEAPQVKKGVNHRRVWRLHIGDVPSVTKMAKILGTKFVARTDRKVVSHGWIDNKYFYLPIKKVERTAKFKGCLHNFEVADVHTYTTNAFLVHNCGDVMDIWLKIDPATERIKDLKWKTFGCGSAIAATSMFSVMVTENGGLTIDEALKIKPLDIIARLDGLPNRKIHCSVLVDQAFKQAVKNYFLSTGQVDRKIVV